ncbi:hypothetical protein KAR10_08080, partial [bacterium]|nr:hypothetical protein [bacterium]
TLKQFTGMLFATLYYTIFTVLFVICLADLLFAEDNNIFFTEWFWKEIKLQALTTVVRPTLL